jgi:gas vesicle protein
MGKSADEVRTEIEDTRQDMSETIDAIADRTSPRRVIGRRRERIADGWRSVRERVMGRAEDTYGSAMDATHDLSAGAEERAGGLVEQARHAPDTVAQQTQGAPVAAGLIAFGGGLLLASLIPPSEPERRVADKVREQTRPLQDELKRAGQEVTDDLRTTAREGAEQVKQRANEAAGTIGDDVRASSQELKNEATR